MALIDRYRWQDMKCLWGCCHWFAESPTGVAIPVYSAIMAALLLPRLTGQRPGKRARERLRFYLLGYLEVEEWVRLLELEKTKD